MDKSQARVVALVALAGILVMGWLSWTSRADESLRAEAERIAATALHEVSVEVAQGQVTLTGLVDSQGERAALTTQIEALDGVRSLQDETEILPPRAPYVTDAYKAPGAPIIVSGAIPREVWREALSEVGADGVQRLDLASGAPDGWLDAMRGGLTALGVLTEGTVRLEDAALTLTGVARDPAMRDRMRAGLGELPEGIAVDTSGVTLLDDGTPPAFEVRLQEGGAASVSGKLPEGVNRSDVAEALGGGEVDGDATTGLTGMSDGPAALAGVTALAALEQGRLRYDDGRLTLEGVAATHADLEAVAVALRDLPSNYDVDRSRVVLQGDGDGPVVTVQLDAGGTQSVTGQPPDGLKAGDVATALGLEDIEADLQTPVFFGASKAATLSRVEAIHPYLPLLETADIALGAQSVTIEATIPPGVALASLETALSEALPNADITLRRARVTAPLGTTRVNALTGAQEVALGGYWLPKVSFSPSAVTCAAQTDAVLAENKITFVTGSAEIAPLSYRTINQLAAVFLPCVTNARLVAEIGGHTDSVGNDGANFRLSADRAQAVAQALEVRGVPVVGLRAVGFGETVPVADNTTEEGRAANRRTTIVWTNLAQ